MLPMHRLTIPPLTRALRIMSHYVDRAEAFAGKRDVEEIDLMNARLAPDMLPFTGQVQRISDNAKNGAARLAGVTAPAFADDEASFAQLRQRLAKTITFLAELTPDQFDGSEDREVTLTFRSIAGTMSGYAYHSEFLMPNIYFHLATAHDILRNNGLPIGKTDYLGGFLEAA